jgi:non-heme chloroperoxidase
VNAVIKTLNLDHPIISGWSYGPLVILDYIRHYGEEGIGGVNFIGGVTKLGTDDALAALTPEFLALVPGFFATDFEEGARSLESLIRLCLAQEPAIDELYMLLGASVSVPPYVRQGLFSRSFNNDDVLAKMRKPALITHGVIDAVVKPEVVEQHKACLPHAQIHMVANTSHAPFWEDPAAFNQRLRSFARSLGSARATG